MTVNTSHVVLPGSQRRAAPGSRAIAPANPNERIEVTVELRHKKPLPALTGRPQTPLSRAEFAAEYGAAAADIATVKQVLAGYGLEVVGEDPAARTVEFAGPVSAAEKAFEVKLFRYASEQGEYRGRSGALHIPAELQGIVLAVYGLDNRRVIQRRRRRPGPALPHLLTQATTQHRGFFPSDLATVYDFPPGDGAGQVIGVLEFGGGFFTDDLELFCRIVNVAQPPVVPVSVGHARTNLHDGAEGEVMLDVEVIAGVCPKAKMPVYFGPDFSEQSWRRTIAQAIHDQQNNPTILSISWGAAEEDDNWSAGAIDRVNALFQEAAMMGVTVCVASGDDGSDDGFGDGRAHVDFPASSPFVLAVGGTDLRVAQGQATERAWKDGDGRRPVVGGTGGSSGGGVSAHFARPAFQEAVTIASVNPGGLNGRVVPDVAAHAQTDVRTTGYVTVVDGQPGLNGGTSAAAPLWAALIARVNAALEKQKGTGKRAGYLTPVLYQAGAGGKPIGAGACKDITAGDNISAHIGGYQCGPGYDAVTGWGSPVGSKLLAALLPIV
jgi:kumamolisin